MHLVIATEAAATTGLGHFVRMSALAEAAAERDWPVTFVLRPDSLEFAREQVRDAGWHLEMADWVVDGSLVPTGARHPAVVVDSYRVDQTGSGWRHARDRADVLMAVNDGGAAPVDVDIVLNNNLPASPDLYPGHRARLMLGTDYTLLRRSFARRRADGLARLEDLPETPRNVLVMLGGTDISGSTRPLADIAASTFGSAHVTAISADLAGQRHGRVEFVAPTPEIAPVIEAADLVIAAGGTTIWELACLAKPAAVLAVADNQLPTYRELVRRGLVIGLGTLPLDVVQARRSLASVAGELPSLGLAISGLSDGRGADRVVDALEEMAARRAVTS